MANPVNLAQAATDSFITGASAAAGGIAVNVVYNAVTSKEFIDTAKKADEYIVKNKNEDGCSHIGGVPFLIGFAAFAATGNPLPLYIGVGISTTIETRTQVAKAQEEGKWCVIS